MGRANVRRTVWASRIRTPYLNYPCVGGSRYLTKPIALYTPVIATSAPKIEISAYRTIPL